MEQVCSVSYCVLYNYCVRTQAWYVHTTYELHCLVLCVCVHVCVNIHVHVRMCLHACVCVLHVRTLSEYIVCSSVDINIL